MSQKIILIAIIITVLIGTYMLTSKKPDSFKKDQVDLSIQPTATPTNMSTNTNTTQTLKIEDIKIGTGPAVKAGDTVVMNYLGTFEDGKKFDSSYDRKQPFETKIGVGQVIEGWDKGVPGMKVGGKRKLTIPSDLAYGDQGIPGAIPPKSTLIFEVELLQIK